MLGFAIVAIHLNKFSEQLLVIDSVYKILLMSTTNMEIVSIV